MRDLAKLQFLSLLSIGDPPNLNVKNLDTVASVLMLIQAIGSRTRTSKETLMKATHPMIRLGQFGTCTKLV